MKPNFNRLALALCLTAAGTSAHAADTFIGYTLGQTNNNIQKSRSLSGADLDKVIHKSGTVGLRVGQQDDTSRYYMTLEKVEGSNRGVRMTQRNLMASYDYFLPVGEHGTKLFGGASAGVVKLSQNARGFSRDSDLGVAAGLQAGAIQPITENFSVETGYRYMRTNLRTEVKPHGGSRVGTTDLHSSGQAYLGVNYQF